MQIDIVTEIGNVFDNFILYNNENKCLENTNFIGGSYLYLLNKNLAFCINYEMRMIVGFMGEIGELDNIPKEDLSLPLYIDGTIKVNEPMYGLIDCVNYVYDFSDKMVYDEKNNILILGELLNNSLCIRVCKNMLVSVFEDKITAAVIFNFL